MRSKLTTLLLISLMMALPLRAVSGLVMFGCAPNHHTATLVGNGHHEVHSMQEISGCHEGHQAPSASTDNCHQDHGPAGKHASSTCSACGDCCSGVMSEPILSQTASSHEPTSDLIVFFDRTYIGHHPEGPEHPPRNALS